MSESARLRKTQTRDGGGRSMNNANAKQHEKKLQDSVLLIKSELELMYPELEFTHRKNLYKREIAEVVDPITPWVPASKDPFISPDGGSLFVEWNGVKYPILISEAKKQGTNDERYKEGLKKQGMGNGIERAPKNALEIWSYCKKYDFNPYVIFCCGCDFYDTSSINDRLDVMTQYEPRGFNYSLFKKDGEHQNMVSIYIKSHHYKEEPNFWTVGEIYEIMKEIAINITNHIIEK